MIRTIINIRSNFFFKYEIGVWISHSHSHRRWTIEYPKNYDLTLHRAFIPKKTKMPWKAPSLGLTLDRIRL